MTKNIKFFLPTLFFIIVVWGGASSLAYAEDVNLTVKNDGSIIFSGAVPLPAPGMEDINDSDGAPHPVDVQSVLYIVNKADELSSDFSISQLIYYPSFNAFYLKCMMVTGAGELCDGWMYKVEDIDPGVGMDSKTLSVGEDVVLFFGEENPEPEPEPEIVPEPEPVVEIPHSSGRGSSRRTRSKVSAPSPAPEVQAPDSGQVKEIIVAEPVPEKEIIKVTVKKEEKKVAPENQITKPQNVTEGNLTAGAILAEEGIEVLSPKKENWLLFLRRMLFGF